MQTTVLVRRIVRIALLVCSMVLIMVSFTRPPSASAARPCLTPIYIMSGTAKGYNTGNAMQLEKNPSLCGATLESWFYYDLRKAIWNPKGTTVVNGFEYQIYEQITEYYQTPRTTMTKRENDGTLLVKLRTSRYTTHPWMIQATGTILGFQIPLATMIAKSEIEVDCQQIVRKGPFNTEVYLAPELRAIGVQHRTLSIQETFYENNGLLVRRWQELFSLNITQDVHIGGFRLPSRTISVGPIRIQVPEISFPGLTIPRGNYELARPVIEIKSRADGTYYAAPNGGSASRNSLPGFCVP